jgi:L-alanine-DL-glutamate epimerase-like enolase superfamily enzyme
MVAGRAAAVRTLRRRMGTYERVADLELAIESYELEGLSRRFNEQFERRTTIFHLHGGGHEGLGEDVTYTPEDQATQQELGPVLPLAGSWTLDSFSPGFEVYRNYRRWAVESAALDLALRQAGRSLPEALGVEPRPITFVVSLRLGEPPTTAPVDRRLASYPGVRFKLDATPDWDDGLLEQLAATGAVASIDFKGAYNGTPVDVPTDANLYQRVAQAFPDAWLEDPDLGPPDAASVLAPYRDRITWDAPIHSVADVEALPFAPRTLNSKPSRFGSLQALMAFADYCAENEIALYGGGQSELGVGRGQIQCLASLFHPDTPNDIAPSGWDWMEFPETGLATSPLDPAFDDTGFRRRA